MVSITEIMDMLDWQMPAKIQSEGRFLAKSTETIVPFIQPLTPKHNKNVWENCALIISQRSDEELKPYLVELLEWLQDLNWPGAFCILNRLQNYSDNTSIQNAISRCIETAKNSNDEIWECNLYLLTEETQGDGSVVLRDELIKEFHSAHSEERCLELDDESFRLNRSGCNRNN